MSYADALEVEWVAACLSPSDIAPHPNFRAEHAYGAELLALILRFQFSEYDVYADHSKDEQDSNGIVLSSDPVLEAARRALQADTLHEGMRDLSMIIGRDDLSYGQRAAAALLAAATDSELDLPSEHTSLLVNLANSVTESDVGSQGSRALIAAALLQQCALRKYEIGDAGAVRDYAIEVRRLLDSTNDSWDDFKVSRGISWSAAETQRRLVEVLDGNALALLVTTGDPLANSWTELVRAPFPAASVPPTREVLRSLVKVVGEVFEGDYHSSRRRRTLGGENEALRLLYSSLLNSELTGDLAGVHQARELLGEVFSVRMARGHGDDTWVAEAIRLLRQGDATDQLQRFLQRVREEGPLQVIAEAAEKLIEVRKKSEYVTFADLLLLEKAADLLPIATTRDALALVDSYAAQERDGRIKGSHSVPWKIVETSLRFIDSLIREDQEASPSEVISQILNLCDPLTGGDQFVYKALANLMSDIDWQSASDSEKSKWLELANSMQSEVLAIDRVRVYAALKIEVPEEIRSNLQGLQFVAALIAGFLGEPPSMDDVAKSALIVEEMLEQVRVEAERGHFTGYGWSPFTLCGLLIAKFSTVELWPAVHTLLAHRLVSSESKVELLQASLDRLTPGVLPPEIHELFQESPIPEEVLDRNSFLDVPAIQYRAVVRNFRLAYGLSNPSSVQSEVLSDVSSESKAVRVETVQSCFLASRVDSLLEWPIILLLQASYDRDGSVRHRAIRSLAFLSVPQPVTLSQSIADRVLASLREPGIASAMGALRGIIDAHAAAQMTEVLWCKEEILALRETHSSRNIRRMADSALSLFRE